MDFHQVAQAEFDKLMDEWGLEGKVTLQYQPRFKRTLGNCRALSPQRALIKYAKMEYYSADFVRDVIRHEVAHAVEWFMCQRLSHSSAWREIAQAIGCHPRSTANVEQRETAVAASQRSHASGSKAPKGSEAR